MAERLVRTDKSIVLVGLMGSGKSAVGRRLARRLAMPFVDADEEITAAAGCSINDIFELYGEAAFRDGERKVIARLLDDAPQVLATGGGAFMDPDTRARIADTAISVWLRAGLDTLVARTRKRDHRPLLNEGDPRDVLDRLMQERYPIYAQADLTVDSREESADATADAVVEALTDLLEPGSGGESVPR